MLFYFQCVYRPSYAIEYDYSAAVHTLHSSDTHVVIQKSRIFVEKTESMIQQTEITLRARSRGFHLITNEILEKLPELPEQGLLHLYIKHTSCALAINENADPDVRYDMGQIFDRMIQENETYYTHTYEGADDMPAHAKAVIVGCSLSIPITHGRLNMGTWQGIYLCEFRNHGGSRHMIATIIS